MRRIWLRLIKRQLVVAFHIGGQHTFQAVERVNGYSTDGSGTPQVALRQLPEPVLTDQHR